MAKLWAGRFEKPTNALLDDFQSSIPFDQRMLECDVTGSIAHATMLGEQGIISKEDAEDIVAGLNTILDEYLANGSNGTGITIRVKVRYLTASGMQATQYFEFTNEMVKKYVTGENGWDNSQFQLYLTGVAGLQGLTFEAEIVSEAKDGSTVVIGSSLIAD